MTKHRDCRCGSGAHPRDCPRHPKARDAHVARLNAGLINWSEVPETEAEWHEESREHDEAVTNLIDAELADDRERVIRFLRENFAQSEAMDALYAKVRGGEHCA